ncbi:radical SAM protein [Rickettsiales bacterium]|nr:radical SAM protein [Rickettsiales bacterium]
MASREKLLKDIEGKDILIWGARMTGLGALRFLKSKGKNPYCFIDSDDCFKNKKVYNLAVLKPENVINEIKRKGLNPFIIIAVALKEDEIKRVMNKYSLNSIEHQSFQREESPYFTVDILSSCNLKCLSCPHSLENKDDAPKGSMNLETTKQVIDKIKKESPDTTHISLYSWGEPLIHPKVDEIVNYIHEKGIAVSLSSNLSIKFNEDKLIRIIKSNPEYLKISVSGFYPLAYNSTHQGGNIDLVKSNLYKIRKLMNQYNSHTLIDINYHLYRNNNDKNLKKFKELAEKLGFILSTTYALVMPFERVINKLEGKPDYQTSQLEKNLLVGIEEGIEISSLNIEEKSSCPFRENQVNINADLSVPVCCIVFNKSQNIVSNNFLDSSLGEISNNKKNITTCKKCMSLRLPEYNMGYNKHLWNERAQSKKSLDI